MGDARCKHPSFQASVAVARLEDSGRFIAEVGVRCAICGEQFQFRGIPAGIDTDGATTTLDGLTARLAIVPRGSEPPPWAGVTGYKFRATGDED